MRSHVDTGLVLIDVVSQVERVASGHIADERVDQVLVGLAFDSDDREL